ncbi:MAG: hypothetical protein Hens3KO_13240 [Henriciella sp.]
MTALDFPVIAFQIVFPIALLLLMLFAPAKTAFGFAIQSMATALALLAVALLPIWMIPPWWTPYVYGGCWLFIIAWKILMRRSQINRFAPLSLLGRAHSLGFAGLGVLAVVVSSDAVFGHFRPAGEIVDLPFPMPAGTYLVANGGSTESVNGHFMTLVPQTERQRAHRGQSFAVDLVKLDPIGVRAQGWRPSDPARYEIFGTFVYAPCDGTVLQAENSRPDMPVPEPDNESIIGNHVFIDCGDFGVLLAHFRHGSTLVRAGDSVVTGQMVGQVGNSGKTFEPHLHMHVQALVSDAPLISGEPVHFTLDGKYLVRNQRIKHQAKGAP